MNHRQASKLWAMKPNILNLSGIIKDSFLNIPQKYSTNSKFDSNQPYPGVLKSVIRKILYITTSRPHSNRNQLKNISPKMGVAHYLEPPKVSKHTYPIFAGNFKSK